MVIDHNNLVFVDQMFMQSLLADGLIAPRAGSNLPLVGAVVRPLFERVGLF